MKIFFIRGSDRAGKVGNEVHFYTRLVDAAGTHDFVYGASGIVTSETITNGVQDGAVITRTPGPWGQPASVSLNIDGATIPSTGYGYDATTGHLNVSARSTLQAKGLSAEWRVGGETKAYAAEDRLREAFQAAGLSWLISRAGCLESLGRAPSGYLRGYWRRSIFSGRQVSARKRIAAARGPVCSLAIRSQLLLANATGRIALSRRF